MNELEQKLAGIDTLVFPDVHNLQMMNEWSRSIGYVNYASYITGNIIEDVTAAKAWLKREAEKNVTEPTIADMLLKAGYESTQI